MSKTIRTNEKPARVCKTYGVKGLMDWVFALPTGCDEKPYIAVPFEGGQITGYGVAPARYTTSDPVIQKLIEASPLFGKKIFFLGESPYKDGL